MFTVRRFPAFIVFFLTAALLAGTAADAQRDHRRDRRWKGAGLGAAMSAGDAFSALLQGKRQADAILAGAAVGDVVGGALGAYMDRQQERLSRIVGTRVERASDDTLLVRFNSDVLFAEGSDALDARGRSTLEQAADVMNDYRKTAVVIQGHTDAVGSAESNQSLSERRARAVERYLATRGVAPGRMTAVGFGDRAPVASNASASGRQRNRRVDVLLKAKSGPLREG